MSTHRGRRGPHLVLVLLAAALAVVVAVVSYTVHRRQAIGPAPSTPPSPTTARAIAPAAAPRHGAAAAAISQPVALKSFMDVVLADYPSLPTTQPLGVPLELNQAARLLLKDPIYLSKSRGDLWITRAEAPPTARVLKDAIDPNAADSQTHVLRERVVFVHWAQAGSGQMVPNLICQDQHGACELVSSDRRMRLPSARDYRWSGAMSLDNDRWAVPSRTGVSVFQIGQGVKESYRDLLGTMPTTAPTTGPGNLAEPQALPDGDGLVAWIPWERGKTGSRGAARYLDGKWTDLGPEQGWPQKLVHLVPLRDGSAFQFVARDDGMIGVETAAIAGATVDEGMVEKLVAQLGDEDPDVRRKAVTELANFGPGAWPVLTRLAGDQPPQARLLLRQLLKDKNRPTLSGLTLLGDRLLQLAARLSDGGVVFYAPQGVSVPEPNAEDPSITAPAWLSVRPGHYVELLPAALVADLKPDACRLDVVGDQWVVNSDSRGPRLFYGNGFATLLRKDERSFGEVIGTDQRGRWLFRKPIDPRRGGTEAGVPETLVIDPHLPDPTPRLPVWNLAIAQTVGWDKDNWPVVANGAAFALTESDWRGLAKDEKFFTRPEPSPPAEPTTAATTLPTTGPGDDPPLLITSDGTRYFGGLTSLQVIGRQGEQIDWPLPAIANGVGPAALVCTKSGKLFLFNQPGRVLRIGRNSGRGEPFKLEAIFTRNIPSVRKPTRVWVDPAGRIDVAWDNRLAILFPDGYVPRAISEKMIDQDGLEADGL